MRKTISLLSLVLITGISIQCKKEGCIDAEAINYDADAKKDDGSCIYPDPDPREPYLGNYTVTDSAFLFGDFSEEVTYTLTVATNNTTGDTIYLNNLWNDGIGYYAILSGDSFLIPSQEVSGPYFVSGSGDIVGNDITYETSGDVYENRGIGQK